MKTYELTYTISPEISLEEAETKAKDLESEIIGKSGVIIKSEKPVAKTLSYRIKKFNSGFLVSIDFQSEPEAITIIKEKIGKDSQILRHIFLVKNPARRIKERRQRIKIIPEATTEPTKEITEEKEEKKATIKKTRTEKSREKVEIEDIDKKLEEILSE